MRASAISAMSEPPTGTLSVALIESNDTVGKIVTTDKDATFKAIDAYADEIAKLRGSHVQLIVLPENIARVAPEWVTEAQEKLAKAAPEGATVVAGFNTFVDGAQRNVSWALSPAAHAPVTYEKRRLVPGLESAVFTPGPGPRTLSNGIGLEICKDMDFHAMIRSDEVVTKPELLAVPAWDFKEDDWSHARVAILRSVENGVPMARTARNGLLLLNDRYGRIVAQARSVGGFTTLIGDLPLDGHGGTTIYDRSDDAFGWLCLVVAFGILAASFARRGKMYRRIKRALSLPARWPQSRARIEGADNTIDRGTGFVCLWPLNDRPPFSGRPSLTGIADMAGSAACPAQSLMTHFDRCGSEFSAAQNDL